MKASLLLLVFFFIVGVYGFPARDQLSPRLKRTSHDDWMAFLKDLNDARRDMAMEGNYANMWKLEWSNDVVERIKGLPKDCSTLTPGSDYRYFFPPIGNDEAKLTWLVAETKLVKSNIAHSLRRTLHGSEILIPGQKTMGCGDYQCKYPTLGQAYGPFDLTEICLMGPVGQLDATLGVVEGEPGSECDNVGGNNEDGLCVPKPAPPAPVPTVPPRPECKDGEQLEDDGSCVPDGSPMVTGIPILVLFVFLISNLVH